MYTMRELLTQQNTGRSFEAPTPEEKARFEVDSYNSSTGNRNEIDGYNCDLCRNKGMTARARQRENGDWYAAYCICDCQKTRESIRRMKRSGLQNIITDYTFAKYETTGEWQKNIKAAAMAYASQPEGWFFIGGQSGAGKTHICAAICRAFLLNHKEVKYMLWRDEAVKLKALVNDEGYQQKIDEYKRVEVLYIDDLFKSGKDDKGSKQRPTAADVNLAFEILNYRYNDPALLTVISSECNVSDILDIDEALGGRIFERAGEWAFSLKPDKSKNYRLKNVCEL